MRYVIQPGDTLSALAKRFNTSVDRLAADNGIKDPDKIYAGRSLTVPDQSPLNWSLWELLKGVFQWR